LSAGSALASIATNVGGQATQAYLTSAGLFEGGVAQAYRAGDAYANMIVSMFDVASYGVIEQHDDSTGVHMYAVVL
jgi:hypothetical protein